eukprot:GGOE01004407.1.p2 GENE.GGOE01004407.1~~GGOE01004407.1.p2  ORF type:complete len:233 (-),score=40.52 GGOE01004407.1:397-1062(-)
MPHTHPWEAQDASNEPRLARTALVHDPYSFDAYVLVTGDNLSSPSCSPPTPATPPRSPFHPSSQDVQGTAAAKPVEPVSPPSSTSTSPSRSLDTEDAIGADNHTPLKRMKSVGKAGGAATAPAIQWNRYGIHVSHMQALKELQDFNKRQLTPPPPEVPWEVRVGPRQSLPSACMPNVGAHLSISPPAARSTAAATSPPTPAGSVFSRLQPIPMSPPAHYAL